MLAVPGAHSGTGSARCFQEYTVAPGVHDGTGRMWTPREIPGAPGRPWLCERVRFVEWSA
ncbi:hypothetical protein GCM10023167_10820 [Brevibacterium pityocampae]|uniref:Uncharacterized protein n=1 Tax=Brevibacterium pityocampae TaxID=506594 RepID=A0ABP8J972_9MICO